MQKNIKEETYRNSIKKFRFIVLLALLFVGFSTVSAQSVEFKTDLYRNIVPNPNEDVKLLQSFLSTQGFYTGAITGNYLTQTYQAVVKFQSTYSITPGNGYFGTSTREKANKMLKDDLSLSTSVRAGVNENTTTIIAAPVQVVNNTVTNTVAVAPAIVNTTTNVSGSVTQAATTQVKPNLIQNPSLEEANINKPNKWNTGKWGTNTATYTYPTAGQNGARSANVAITAYTSGDAKWYFEDVLVTPGASYTFSEYYKSNVTTNVTIRWTKLDGTVVYQSLGNPVPATSWTLRTNTITVPANTKSMTIFHVLRSVGTLDIDNYKLVSNSSVTVPTSPTVPVVNATVSGWSNWVAVSSWSTCSVGQQTRTEERSRTVLSVATGGGATPSLKELRTAAQTCGTTTPTQPTTPTVPTVPSTPTTPAQSGTLNFPKKEWGAYVGWEENDLAEVEGIVGSQARYRAVFIHWGNEKTFPAYLKPTVKDKGKTLVIFWEATNYNVGTVNQSNYSYDSIINGNWDSYIAQFVADAKAYGGEVILIPFSEMNGNWFPWAITQNGNNAQKHIDAWRKIREAFRGATNVKFGWAPNHDAVPDTAENQFEKFYPGDAYVDYVGLDGFNFNNPWMTFDQIFKEGLTKMKVYKKPVYIFSFASAEGSQKGAWISDALNVQIPKYPEIKGWIWFHEDKEKDWRINSDTSALNAFKLALPLTLPLPISLPLGL